MEERTWWTGLAVLALGLAFAVVSALLWASNGRSYRLLKAKLRLGGLLLGLGAVASGCGDKEDSAFIMCYDAGFETDTVHQQDIEVDATELSFDAIAVGETSTQYLTIRNNGGLPLTVSALDLSDPEAPFAVDTTTPFELQADEEAIIGVTFQPNTHGGFEATLTIRSDDPDHPDVSVLLSGEAVVP